MYPRQGFTELINQGNRDCVVVAVDGTKLLYEYEMPNGTSAIRNERGKPVPYRALSRFWLRLIEDDYGIDNLIANPQQNGIRGRLHEFLKNKLNGVTLAKND